MALREVVKLSKNETLEFLLVEIMPVSIVLSGVKTPSNLKVYLIAVSEVIGSELENVLRMI